MSEDNLIVVLVLFAALLHASWNALVKGGQDKLIVLATANFVGTVFGFVCIFILPFPDAAAWPYLIASAIFHTGYYFYLLNAYEHGDLSQVYPLARGTAPLLITTGAWVFADESISIIGMLGICLASCGIIALSFENGSPFNGKNRAVIPALVTSLWIAAYSVTDGIGGRLAGNVFSYIVWLAFIDGIPIVLYTMRIRGSAEVFGYLRSRWMFGVLGGTFSLLAYGTVIYAMSLGAMGMVSALRETSVIMAALIGIIWFREKLTRIRVIAAIVVTLGVLLIKS